MFCDMEDIGCGIPGKNIIKLFLELSFSNILYKNEIIIYKYTKLHIKKIKDLYGVLGF